MFKKGGRKLAQETILEVKNLKKYFPIKGGIFGKKTLNQVKAVDDVSFHVNKGETLGIVGESGCGKSTTGKTILQLIEATDGEVLFKGKDITKASKQEMKNLRREIQIIFQDPFASLNPRMKVGEIIEEPLINFGLYEGKKARRERVLELMDQVGLRPEQIDRHPHEFSGGQRQRIGIARALACEPSIIIADEPVSALDVSIQSQVLNLLRDLQKELGLTYIFISHDLSVVKHFCNRIGVMYLGRMVEMAGKHELYDRPLHPYAEALLSAVPVMDPKRKKKDIILEGDVPSPSDPPKGCAFHPRCPMKMDICSEVRPQLENQNGRFVACHLYDQPTEPERTG
ncbi:dipeptide ABC transporter ATP-binding protein [Halobacillus litoralis]|uniref:Dipeptide ABC transporter ATP-binding protein n=1 Tax=Halobacillus litoralis TaxID=45668 RepID=A0A845E0R4_9BACI|nr:dipeptide ABC transporter ATP-binding protein [Halobacillus litoralis]MYL49327.1 dipeptide ABC transporter ATP-binding protein [Halobacillus litoralis]